MAVEAAEGAPLHGPGHAHCVILRPLCFAVCRSSSKREHVRTGIGSEWDGVCLAVSGRQEDAVIFYPSMRKSCFHNAPLAAVVDCPVVMQQSRGCRTDVLLSKEKTWLG